MGPSTDPLATMSVRQLLDRFAAGTSDEYDCHMVEEELTRRCSPPTVGPGEGSWVCGRCGEAPELHGRADSRCVYEPVLLSRPGPDAGVPEEVRAAAQRLETLDNWLYNGLDNFPDGLTDSGLVKDARTMARFVLSLSPARGYDAGFAAGRADALAWAADWADEELSLQVDRREFAAAASCRALRERYRREVSALKPPAADRDAGKCPTCGAPPKPPGLDWAFFDPVPKVMPVYPITDDD